MDIQKQLEQGVSPGVPGEEDLALINGWARRELAAQEVYVFRVTLCDNEIDRDGERFTAAGLEKLAALFPGKTGLFDHSGKSGDQVMRVYDAFVQRAAERKNSLGEAYAALCAKVYLLRSEENAALIRAIDAGIKKEVSVSCAVKRVACSACGKAWGKCDHKKGVAYDNGKPCHAVLEEPTDAYEFSFVAVPAQPQAGVMKKKQESVSCGAIVSFGAADKMQDEAERLELEQLAADGRAYRAQLLEKTLRQGLLAVPGMGRRLLEPMCGGLSTAQLKSLCAAFEEQAAKTLPLRPQLRGAAEGEAEGNEGFKL